MTARKKSESSHTFFFQVLPDNGYPLHRKHIVKVVLAQQHKEILDNICAKLGQS
jgi:hypothetical protein